MNTVGFGVIGAGVIGAMRARTIRKQPAAALVGVADIDLDRARVVAASDSVHCVTDYRHLLDDPGIHAVVIASPVQHHEEMAIAALEAGRHVLIEKPLANSVAACRHIVEAADRAQTVLAVGFNHRYYPSFRRLKQIVDAGTLGAIDHVRAFGGHEGMTQFRAPWMYERATLGGGAMMDVGIHVADLVQHLGFQPRHVHAVMTHGVWNVPGSEDNAIVTARTAEGVPISYQATWSEWKGYRLRVEVYGRLGMAMGFYPPLLNLVWRRTESTGARHREWHLYPALNVREKLRGWETTAEDAFAAELGDVLRRIRGEPAACATGIDGLRAVEFAAAALRSSDTGQVVDVTAIAP